MWQLINPVSVKPGKAAACTPFGTYRQDCAQQYENGRDQLGEVWGVEFTEQGVKGDTNANGPKGSPHPAGKRSFDSHDRAVFS